MEKHREHNTENMFHQKTVVCSQTILRGRTRIVSVPLRFYCHLGQIQPSNPSNYTQRKISHTEIHSGTKGLQRNLFLLKQLLSVNGISQMMNVEGSRHQAVGLDQECVSYRQIEASIGKSRNFVQMSTLAGLATFININQLENTSPYVISSI